MANRYVGAMTAEQADNIRRWRKEGVPASEMARRIGPEVNYKRIESYCVRHGLRRETIVCLNCHEPFATPPDAPQAKTCCDACHAALKAARDARHKDTRSARRRANPAPPRPPRSREPRKPQHARVAYDHPPCAWAPCSGPIVRGEDERRAKYRARHYCCDQCAYLGRAEKRYAGVRAAQSYRAPKPRLLPIPVGDDYAAAVARFAAERGITVCPPAYVAPTPNAAITDAAEVARRIVAIKIEVVDVKRSIWGGAR